MDNVDYPLEDGQVEEAKQAVAESDKIEEEEKKDGPNEKEVEAPK